MCKPTGRVKVGKKVFKPSVEEAREAFIQKVAVSIMKFVILNSIIFSILCIIKKVDIFIRSVVMY